MRPHRRRKKRELREQIKDMSHEDLLLLVRAVFEEMDRRMDDDQGKA